MERLKLSLRNIEGAEVLSREQLKKIVGGDWGSGDDGGCTSTSDCPAGQKCVKLGTLSGCQTVDSGSSCTSDSDCGNGQTCRSYQPPASGKYCA